MERYKMFKAGWTALFITIMIAMTAAEDVGLKIDASGTILPTWTRSTILYESMHKGDCPTNRRGPADTDVIAKKFGDPCTVEEVGNAWDECTKSTITISFLVDDGSNSNQTDYTCTVTSFLGSALQCTEDPAKVSQTLNGNGKCTCAETSDDDKFPVVERKNFFEDGSSACLKQGLTQGKECISQWECKDGLYCEFKALDTKDCITHMDLDPKQNPNSKCWVRICNSSQKLVIPQIFHLALLSFVITMVNDRSEF